MFIQRSFFVAAFLIFFVIPTAAHATIQPKFSPAEQLAFLVTQLQQLRTQVDQLMYARPASQLIATTQSESTIVRTVPFYSQFTDITKPGWQKVGCGIASIAMVIDYYSDATISVDMLLEKGIARNAYLSNAGWTHAGLIGLSNDYGLDGESRSLANMSADSAVVELTNVLQDGPVLASVHYTFEPTNPIPHLVVINDIRDGLVYYNDPADAVGNETLTIEQFKRGWKQRYIVVRPV